MTAPPFDRCVYALFRENGQVFYIGKGAPDRPGQHEAEARKGIKGAKGDAIREMLRRGFRPIVVIIHEGLTEAQAVEYEIALISAIGRADLGWGPLVNRTEGGEGVRGYKRPRELIEHHAALMRGRKLAPEIRALQTARLQSPEHRAKVSAAHRGRKLTPEHVEKVRAALLGRSKSAEEKSKNSIAHRGKKMSPESIAKTAAAIRGRKYSPERYAKFLSIVQSPEYRRKMSLAQSGKRMSPEAIAKTAAALRGRKLSIATRTKISITKRSKSRQSCLPL